VNDFFQGIPRQDDPEDDPLMEVLQDVLDNGGRVPDEVTPRLLMGAIRSTYRATIRGLNTSRPSLYWLAPTSWAAAEPAPFRRLRAGGYPGASSGNR